MAGKLSRLASETGTTMYMVLLSAFNILLHKSTGKEDLIVGSSVAGRPHSDLENVVGMFVNMLAMRNKPKADITYYDFLADVRENALKAFENQDYQFEKLVDKLGLERDSSRNPLFDVAFVLQNTGLGNMEASNVKFTPYIMESKISKFDLTFYAWETDKGIDFIIEYSTALFKRESIEEMSRQFIRIIKSITDNKLTRIKDIAFYDEEKAGSIIGEIHKNQRDIVIDIDFYIHLLSPSPI
jgi:non-ribosomal peptide synthetase component F